jgi:hypothetical protein
MDRLPSNKKEPKQLFVTGDMAIKDKKNYYV